MDKIEIKALREKASLEGGLTDYSCPQCGDIFWGGFCQCRDNLYQCDKCGEDEKHCKCYPWVDQMAIENARRCIATYGHRACSDRVYLARLLGYEKAAHQILAQINLHGSPGPRPQLTEAQIVEARAYLAELEALGESEPDPTPAELEASGAAAREALADCPFGSNKWSEEVWASIDARLGADLTSIAKADAEHKAATAWRASMVDGKFVYDDPEHEITDPGRLHQGRHA